MGKVWKLCVIFCRWVRIISAEDWGERGTENRKLNGQKKRICQIAAACGHLSIFGNWKKPALSTIHFAWYAIRPHGWMACKYRRANQTSIDRHRRKRKKLKTKRNEKHKSSITLNICRSIYVMSRIGVMQELCILPPRSIHIYLVWWSIFPDAFPSIIFARCSRMDLGDQTSTGATAITKLCAQKRGESK